MTIPGHAGQREKRTNLHNRDTNVDEGRTIVPCVAWRLFAPIYLLFFSFIIFKDGCWSGVNSMPLSLLRGVRLRIFSKWMPSQAVNLHRYSKRSPPAWVISNNSSQFTTLYSCNFYIILSNSLCDLLLFRRIYFATEFSTWEIENQAAVNGALWSGSLPIMFKMTKLRFATFFYLQIWKQQNNISVYAILLTSFRRGIHCNARIVIRILHTVRLVFINIFL